MRTLLLGLLLGIVLTLCFVSLPLFAGPCDHSFGNLSDVPHAQDVPTTFSQVGPIWHPTTNYPPASVWPDKER
jgi:hypothetical protein